MANTKKQKKIQKYYIAYLRESRNSRTDEQLEKPHHIDHSKECTET